MNASRQRYSPVSLVPPPAPVRLGMALRRALSRGYGARDLRADILAGLVVGVAALPLNMALAIASGVRPENGLYTAIIAGFLIALLGGSKFRCPGPRRHLW